MVNEKCSFIELINGTTYIVNMKPAEKAELTYEELAKKLISQQAMLIEPEEGIE